MIGTPTGTSFVDSGLAAGHSYSYTVTAVDAAGNQSASSPAFSVSTRGHHTAVDTDRVERKRSDADRGHGVVGGVVRQRRGDRVRGEPRFDRGGNDGRDDVHRFGSDRGDVVQLHGHGRRCRRKYVGALGGTGRDDGRPTGHHRALGAERTQRRERHRDRPGPQLEPGDRQRRRRSLRGEPRWLGHRIHGGPGLRRFRSRGRSHLQLHRCRSGRSRQPGPRPARR